MPKRKLSFLLLALLVLSPRFDFAGQTSRSEEERPQIDVEDYQVEAELLPASQQLKAKASIRFVALQDSVSFVNLELNSNLKPQRMYLADKPPTPGSGGVTCACRDLGVACSLPDQESEKETGGA